MDWCRPSNGLSTGPAPRKSSVSAPSGPAFAAPSLIDSRFDHDSCGVGFVASVAATPSHTILQQALTALGRLAHRGAIAADGKSSDGVGLLTAVPRELLLRETGLSLPADQPLGVGML